MSHSWNNRARYQARHHSTLARAKRLPITATGQHSQWPFCLRDDHPKRFGFDPKRLWLRRSGSIASIPLPIASKYIRLWQAGAAISQRFLALSFRRSRLRTYDTA